MHCRDSSSRSTAYDNDRVFFLRHLGDFLPKVLSTTRMNFEPIFVKIFWLGWTRLKNATKKAVRRRFEVA
jgi:hypothetical protein